MWVFLNTIVPFHPVVGTNNLHKKRNNCLNICNFHHFLNPQIYLINVMIDFYGRQISICDILKFPGIRIN